MVLAAGIGSRLKPYTLHTPKPLVPLLGVPCIEYSLLQLRAAHIKNIVVNVHAHPDQMRKYLAHQSGMIQISDESENLLGSAGGFRKALPMLEPAFFSLNADVVSLVNLEALEKRHQELRQKHGVVMTLCLAHGQTLANQEGSYTEILVDETTGLVTGAGEKKNKVPFYTGTAIFETQAFQHLVEGMPAEFTPEVLLPWIKKGKVGFFWMDALWVDVGSPELWWKSHFKLMDEMNKNSIPNVWKNAITEGMKTGCFSKLDGVVDYDLPATSKPTDKNYICYKGDRLDV